MFNKTIKKLIKSSSLAGTKNEASRLKWLEETLLKIPEGMKILDAGAGELTKKKYCSHLHYVSQDFAQYDGKGNNKGIQTKSWDNSKLDIISDITSIPVPNESFDAVMCIEVFEHIPDPLSAIREFARLLRPGGYLVITAPFCSATHFAPYHFYTGFNSYFYEKHLPDNGFEIKDIDFNGNFFEFVAQELLRVQQCARQYTGRDISLLDKAAIMKVIFTMTRLSRKDKGSNEFLNNGLHVFAQKKQ